MANDGFRKDGSNFWTDDAVVKLIVSGSKIVGICAESYFCGELVC